MHLLSADARRARRGNDGWVLERISEISVPDEPPGSCLTRLPGERRGGRHRSAGTDPERPVPLALQPCHRQHPAYEFLLSGAGRLLDIVVVWFARCATRPRLGPLALAAFFLDGCGLGSTAGRNRLLLITESRRVPARRSGTFGIGRRLDVVRTRPGPALLRRHAAAGGPALRRARTAAGVVLAWIRRLPRLAARSRDRQRQVERGREVTDKRQRAARALRQRSPVLSLRPGHGRLAEACDTSKVSIVSGCTLRFKECLFLVRLQMDEPCLPHATAVF